MKKGKQEPAIVAAKKAYRASRCYKLHQLLAEESRWKRKLTIASNKLADVRRELNQYTAELIQELEGKP